MSEGMNKSTSAAEGQAANVLNAEVLQYINNKAEALARYSEKLRENVAAIERVFGDSRFCRVCGHQEWEHARYAYIPGGRPYSDDSYTNKLPEGVTPFTTREEALKWWHEQNRDKDAYYVRVRDSGMLRRFPEHEFLPKIECNCGTVIADEEIIVENSACGTTESRLALADNEIKLVVVEASDKSILKDYVLSDASRSTLKQVVREGLLQKLLAKIAKHLDELNEEYKEVSELAERLAGSVEAE